MTDSHYILSEWTALVDEADKRNGAVDLRIDPAWHELEDDRSAAYRVRLLRVDRRTAQWIVDRPFSLNGEVSLTIGLRLQGTIGTDSLRLGFKTEIVGVESFRLNDTQKVRAMRLAEPHSITSAQRRAYYRVPMLGQVGAGVTVWPVIDPTTIAGAELANQQAHQSGQATGAPGSAKSLPVVSWPVEAALVDLSAGGVALRAERDQGQTLEDNALFWLELRLPKTANPVGVAARIVRLEREENGQWLAAMSFSFDNLPVHRKFVTEHLCRFSAAEQRRQLQRQR